MDSMDTRTYQLQLIKQLKNALQALSVENQEFKNGLIGDNISGENINIDIYNDDELVKFSQKFIDFTYNNPTTYHVIDYASQVLKENGFIYLSEKENWNDKINVGKYFTIRNGTSLVAFIIGKDWEETRGVGAIGCHVDALAAKLKPASIKESVEGYELLGVAPYGGTLNHLWFDRDLGVGGCVLFKNEKDNKIKSILINSTPSPIAKIPSLAPHFGKSAEGPFDKEDQAVPVIGFHYLEKEDDIQISEEESKCPLIGKHSIHLLRYIAKIAGIKVSQIVQLDLDLFDVQKGSLGGLNNEFLFAPRLDDRLCSFAALWALVLLSKTVTIDSSDNFTLLGLFDNEEVGSLTRQGAKGWLMESAIEKVASARFGTKFNNLRTVFANSIILSADVNHLFNPNFKEVYMKNHSPKPNVGVAISLDPNAHMATDVVGLAFVEELARKNGDKMQYFQIKNNSRSGGTIGPSIASQTGARTIDLGIPQLAMHSIRATTGSKDVGLGIRFFKGFYNNWRDVYDNYGDL
ncbi:metalloaminopeptidase APE1 PWA37_001236 [Arxiozyma heterogenica]|uniref:metalloaminopeptidase APE1 n=1 Tax=Arxiozyma heterogenica TaxID=278026 RepID=UPI002EEC20D6